MPMTLPSFKVNDTVHVAYASTMMKPKSFESRRNSLSHAGRTLLVFTCVLRRCVASTVLLVHKLLGGADSVGGQLRGDMKCPFSGVTSCDRVWRKMPESDAWSVH